MQFEGGFEAIVKLDLVLWRRDLRLPLFPLGHNSIGKFWLEFRLEKPLEFWLEIPYTKKMFKNG